MSFFSKQSFSTAPLGITQQVMTNYAEGHPESQKICDSLLRLMQEWQPDIERKEAKHTCAISQHGQSRFAFLYHRKTTPEVTIYFRADPDNSGFTNLSS